MFLKNFSFFIGLCEFLRTRIKIYRENIKIVEFLSLGLENNMVFGIVGEVK